jgi:phytoene dehydrogenase-like protein
MSGTYDAIVIGAGHNGLVAAATLARKGRSVCVLERAGRVGGMAQGGTLDGVEVPRLAHLLYNLDPDLGAGIDAAPLPTVAFDPGGRHVIADGARLAFADGGAHPDAAAFAGLHGRLTRYAALLKRLAERPPPSLAEGVGDMTGIAGLGLALKRMGKDEMRDFLRILLSNAYDLILDEMPDGPAAGMLAADAVRGNWAGPRGPGTVFSLLYRFAQGGGAALPRGGMGAAMEALADAARGAGAEIRLDSGVASVDLRDGRVCGVTLEDGTALTAAAVLASVAAPRAMRLAGPAAYDIEAVRRLRNLRGKGTVAKLNAVLSAAPEIPGLSGAQRGARLVLAPSADHVERAFNPVKYAEPSPAPVIEALVIPQGDRCVLSAVVQYVPPGADREAVQGSVMEALAPFMPDLKGLVQTAELLTPQDIEDMTGAQHWHHADMALDQVLTLRPAPGLARHAFGIPGYYLCGASAHPGGDVTGLPGRNAARQVLGAKS